MKHIDTRGESVENIKWVKPPQKNRVVWNYYQDVREKIKMHRKRIHQSKRKKMEEERTGRIVRVPSQHGRKMK
jgi:hypothetical protein